MSVMKDRILRDEGYLEGLGAVPQGCTDASTHKRNNEEDEFNAKQTCSAKDLLERICMRENMEKAYLRVVKNKGVGGIDEMQVTQLKEWLEQNYETLIDRLRAGKYKPKPALRVEIPKDEKGNTRPLGIPTVIDRMVQQAIVQILTPIYEPQFSDFSFGFRPNRSTHGALKAIKGYADEGYVWVASIDIEKFFDTMNQSKLVQLLSDSLKDGRLISLIHKYLMAGVMIDGVVHKTEQGTPQGGPLSPLLANIMLNELDKELARKECKFVRYADDCVIMKRSKRAAERTLEKISKFIEEKLFLRVNKEKSYVAHITDKVKYLGYAFSIEDDEAEFFPHKKAVAKLKSKIRHILSRSNGWSVEYRQKRLRQLITGWVNYFKLTSEKYKLIFEAIDGWCRRKIRCIYWKQWKLVRTRYRELVKLGANKKRAWQWANTRKGYWCISSSQVLQATLTNKVLAKLGWDSFLGRYEEVKCQN